MNLDLEKIEIFKQLLETPKKVVILSHTNPDGDAIGSSLAISEVLKAHGHTVHCILPNRFPYYLKWMPKSDELIIHAQDKLGLSQSVIEAADIVICADMSSLSRLEALTDIIAANTTAKRILIDHHLNPSSEFDLVFSSPESSSTAYLVSEILKAAYGRQVFNQTIATLLYVGMITDTGNFAFSNINPALFRAAADLLETGIDVPTIYNNVYNSFTEGRARLFGYVINRKMKTLLKGTVAYISLTEDEMRKFWFQQGDSEGFVNYPLSIKKVKMSAMFSEQQGGFIRVSLRSHGKVDVNTFARRYFNGGGHHNAAGGKSFMNMEDTIAHYIKSVEEYHNEGMV
ncbi:MAG: bifunctional oligoribonuclease/PAP phosphatase NrnA [Alistipes sp.]|nr:bifunctional oligoribonuclease/PAP phosphatase NrnA [Alistipes sp.]MBQ9962076.1 bifunctional oligoribonuclease/PAP phosphatase NrnA [Alistipes sp.]